MREPGFIIFKIFGRIIKLTSGKRYMVSTVAGERSMVRILLANLDQVAHACLFYILARLLGPFRIDFKTDRLDAVFFGRHHHDPTIAPSRGRKQRPPS